MLNRLDLVVFGASGYTGKHIVQELLRIAKDYPGLTWAVAGRNREKLETLLHDVSKKYGVDLSTINIIVADVGDKESLINMCKQAKLIVNCCGPFMKYGEPVVATAVHCKTHYIDVNGEKQFVALLEQKYDQMAREAGVYVITTCGLSSVPADLGVLYLQKNFGGTVNSVESYLIMHFPKRLLAEKTKGIVQYSSWESMINSMSGMRLQNIQQPTTYISKPELKQRFIVHKKMNRWCLPFPGTDAEVVKRTQLHLFSQDAIRPVQYKSYITFLSIFSAMVIVIVGIFLLVLSKISFTRKFLLNYPRLCTFGIVKREEPDEGVMDGMRMQYEMFGEGWDEGVNVESTPPKKKLAARISVSGRNPAYVGTAVVAIFCAIAVLREKDVMPPSRGVIMPGVAFKNTTLIKNLKENDVKFEIIPDIK